MSTEHAVEECRPPKSADLLAVGLGTSATMWTLAYAARLIEQHLASPRVVFVLLCLVGVGLLFCHVAGGFVLGRYAGRGGRGGAKAGAISGLVNLLAVASAFGGDQPNQLRPTAPLWIGGTLASAALLTAMGAVWGVRRRPDTAAAGDWTGGLAIVAAGAAFVLLGIGGFVTGLDEGLAVVDWPNTETYNMFLYPLERMTGGVFLEHSHRLFGSLVGLTTLVLTIQVVRDDRRRGLKMLALLALLFVIAQGILGGLRVTGRFTLSADPSDTRPSVILAIVHGTFGQVIFALLVALAVLRSHTWRHSQTPRVALGCGVDRGLAAVLAALLLVQLVAGALVRHFSWALQKLRFELDVPPDRLVAAGHHALLVHITLAVLVALAAVAAGVRAWGLYPDVPLLRRLVLVLLQVALGIAALIVTGDDAPDRPPPLSDAVITTGHQVGGAALLALAVMLALWTRRLLTPEPRTPPAVSAFP